MCEFLPLKFHGMTQVDIENLGFIFLQIFHWNFKCQLTVSDCCGDLTLLKAHL